MIKPITASAALMMLLLLGNTPQAQAQCLGAAFGQWPGSTFTPACAGSTQNITTCGFASEYSLVNVTSGEIYEFASSVSTDFITISDADGTTALAWGPGPLVWQATLSGTVRFYTHLDASCGSQGSCRTKSVFCPATLPTAPVLEITPSFGSTIDFGSGGSDDQLEETLTAANVGTADLDLDCTISDDGGGVFSLQPSDPFSVTLSPGADPVDFEVLCALPTLAPGASETFSGELSCTTNDPDLPGQNTFELACAGEGPPTQPQLDISPTFGSLIDFGSGGSDDQLEETLTAANVGTADLDLDCTISNDGGGVFSLQPSDPFSVTLSPGADPVDFEVLCALPTLAPGASETFSGELSCTTNDPDLPGQNTFELACTGEGPPTQPQLDISPAFGSLIDLGSGESGDQLDQAITMMSIGNVDVDLDCSISDSANGVFTLQPSDPFSVALSPGADPIDFNVLCSLPALAPGAFVTFNGELSCTTNDSNFPGDNTFGLLCVGSAAPPAIPVPTMGRWGFLVLMLGLLALTGFRLRAGRHT